LLQSYNGRTEDSESELSLTDENNLNAVLSGIIDILNLQTKIVADLCKREGKVKHGFDRNFIPGFLGS
jgi:hypothetical protein